MENYKVYIHIFPNKKVYIGITKQEPKHRWRNGTHYDGNKYMTNAIKKYGWENIQHKILFDNLSKEEAEQKEIELIKQYNSTNRDYGYNILEGGNVSQGMSEEARKEMSIKRKGKHYSPRTEFKKGNTIGNCKGRKLSLEIRKKLSESHKGIHLSEEAKRKLSENNARYWLNKKRSEETKKKISEKLKGRTGNMSYWFGKHHTEKTKQKISNSKKGTISSLRKKVLCIETQCIYDSLTEASIKAGTNLSHISQCCNGKRKSAGKLHWKFIEN